MKILITGDTHGHIKEIYYKNKEEKYDYLFFTGDHYKDGLNLAEKLNLESFVVKGNCDRGVTAIEEEFINLANYRFLLLHGHSHFVKNTLNNIYFYALEKRVDFLIYGHTHIPYLNQHEALYFINPGSPTFPRSSKKGTYVVLEIEDKNIKNVINAKIHYL